MDGGNGGFAGAYTALWRSSADSLSADAPQSVTPHPLRLAHYLREKDRDFIERKIARRLRQIKDAFFGLRGAQLGIHKID